MAYRPVGASNRQDLFAPSTSRAPTSRSILQATGRDLIGGTPSGRNSSSRSDSFRSIPETPYIPPATNHSRPPSEQKSFEPPPTASAPNKIGDEVTELEHALGYTGHFLRTVDTHPLDPSAYARSLGSVLVLSNLQNPHESHYLKGHDMEITCIEISPSGSLVASGQLGSTTYKGYHAPIIIWDFHNKNRIFILEGITVRVCGVSFSPDEAFLSGFGEDGVFYIWDLQNGEVAFGKRYPTPVSLLRWISRGQEGRRPFYKIMMCVGSDVLLSTLAFDSSSRQWLLTSQPMAMPGSGLVRSYLSVCLTADTLFCIAGTTVGDFAVFRADTGVYRASLPIASGGISAVASNPADGFLYCGAGDGSIRKVRGSDLRWQLHSEVQLDGRITSLAVVAGGEEILAGTAAGSIFRVNCETLVATAAHASHIAPVQAVGFPLTRSDIFATASLDGSVIIWDLNDYGVISRAGRRNSGGCLCLGWIGEAEVVCGFGDHTVRSYLVATGASSWEIPNAHRSKVNTLAVHTDERMGFLVTGAEDGAVRVWALRTREMLLQFTEHKKAVSKVLVDIVQPHLIHSASLDCSVFTYNIQTERRTVVHMTREGAFLDMTQRLDSEQELVTSDTGGRLFYWDCDVPDPVMALQDPSRKRVNTCAVSPTGKYLAFAGEDQRVKVLDFSADGEIISACHAHSGSVLSLAWSPDERQIITVGEDCCICVWNFYGQG